MKKLTTLLSLALLLAAVRSNAQTTIYKDTIINTGANWTLNTADLGGVTTGMPNQWVINNSYLGGTIIVLPVANTPDQPGGITGSPESYYLHIDSKQGENNGFYNANYNASGTHSYFAAMNNSISTVGYTNVQLSFWYLCAGSANSYGQVYYRTSASGTWIQLGSSNTTPAAIDSYNSQSNWVQAAAIHTGDFDNQAFLQFGFRFKHNASGNDPAFSVDDITVAGTAGTVVTPPTASFTYGPGSGICQDSCITATSNSTGTIDSMRWSTGAVGATISNPTGATSDICFHTTGTHTITLTVYNSAGSDASHAQITVDPAPHPAITKAGHTLSVVNAGMYTYFQWTKNGVNISSANSSTYTYTVPAIYNVIADSAGCHGLSNTISTVGIPMVSNGADNYWLTQDNSTVSLFAAQAQQEPVTVSLYDATGRKLTSNVWQSGTASQYINTGTLAAGMYIIHLDNANTAVVLKFKK